MKTAKSAHGTQGVAAFQRGTVAHWPAWHTARSSGMGQPSGGHTRGGRASQAL
jgi:hypothetical protein